MANTSKTKRPSTQQYLDIAEIHDGVVVLKDGSLRAVLMVSSVNFALKSEKEKDAIIFNFQNFLNYLTFDIQVLIRSRRLDLRDYMKNMNEVAKKQKNPQLRDQTNAYISFIESLLEVANIMDKKFFVVVPFYPNVVQATSGFASKIKDAIKPAGNGPVHMGNFEENRIQLMQRVDVVVGQLSGMELRCASLDTQELIDLFYASYNPDTAQNQKLVAVDQITNNIITAAEDKPEGTELMEI
ncbi:MAG: hypothetical protein UU65_C0002G0193 [candidate division CPR2 bacterium GW2011_GWC1_41_48]|uniref:TraC-like domain-containing protein n=1 Tax=candidate division CPR2 bacterium GW2011_GWC1_41_48 TaxID=1618344 RepID=A0A0G0W8V2_UNCC2|nr:MAG: hypothetical protein UT47_C0002G0111 [candidate division CPR2 bacterium GW2011_GWC2_39_35]KKS09415.1 MAG: hypothetical protein UU65_C0002G0193 [candidate division CPR2 bacterium GW2011_GWC1_41_48]